MRPHGTKKMFRHPDRSAADVRVDVNDEVSFHIEMRTEDLMKGGASEEDARRQSLAEFGRLEAGAAAIAQFDDRVERRRRLGQFAAELEQDARLGLRLLARSPGFTTVAALMLALGIGANTAIFSVLDAALLRPLPYPDADRIVMISETLENGNQNSVSGGAFLDWRTHQTQFDAVVLTGRVSYNLRGAGTPERLTGMEVSHEFLDVLRVPPLLGRGFLPEEDDPGGPTNVVMLTEELWRSRFGADRSIVGRTIILDEVPRTVIGVLPRGAWLIKEDTFFVPAVLQPNTERTARAGHWAGVFGRVKSTSSVSQADAELKAIKLQLNPQYPAFKQRWSVQVQTVTEIVGGLTRAPMMILLGAVSLVLLIASANVASLLLARGCQREHELSVRAAIGASSGRLIRQILTENLVLAAFGGGIGIVVARFGVDVLSRLAASAMPVAFAPHLDLRVLLFSLAITILTGAVVGILPALRARRLDLSAAMNTGSKGVSSGGRQRSQSLLIVAEVALTVLLLASAGLLLRSLARTAAADPGFDQARVLAFDVSLPDASYKSGSERLEFARTLLTHVRALPGVEAAGTGMAIPFAGGGYGEFFSRPGNADVKAVIGRVNFVSAGYLEALHTRLLAGRYLADADNQGKGQRVAVISEWTARTFFPKGDAIGQTINVRSEIWQVVGVIADVVDRRLDVPRGAFAYVPSAFNPSRFSVALRTPLDPLALVAAVRNEVARIDPGVAVARPRGLDEAMAESMGERRVVLALVAAFAITALALAAIGLYGVMAYTVATRRREFGVRMAFGATAQGLIRHVLRDGLRVTGLGVVLGLVMSAGAARLLATQLYQVRASDPLVITGTAILVIAVAVLACLLPAWRASRFDLTTALRD